MRIPRPAVRLGLVGALFLGCSSGASDGGAADDQSVPVIDLSAPPGSDLAVARGSDLAAPPAGGLFPPGAPWTQDVSQAALDKNSAAIIAWLKNAGGWGNGNKLQIDFSINVLQADQKAPFLAFNPTGDFYSPDCDHVPVPVPAGGALEGEQGYSCTQDGDCHLIVIHQPTRKLYEMWRADITNGVFNGGCLAVWDLTRLYPPSGRGEQCTSADAGGFPMAALLFNADEVAAGHIDHAIRFILPNSRILKKTYVHPATHATSSSGTGSAPPYGVHLRLRANYPLANLPNDAARTVARALQKYGMFLSDGGNIALTAQNDRFTTAKWANLNFDSHSLFGIQVTDFEVLDSGPQLSFQGNCVRNPF